MDIYRGRAEMNFLEKKIEEADGWACFPSKEPEVRMLLSHIMFILLNDMMIKASHLANFCLNASQNSWKLCSNIQTNLIRKC